MPHRRSSASSPPPSHPLPTVTHHHSPIIVPTAALVESVAGAAHYSGIHVDPDITHRRHSPGHDRRMSYSEEHNADHSKVLEDVAELFDCKPTPEIFNRRVRKDAIFEDPLTHCRGYAEFAPQFYGLAAICTKSENVHRRVMSSTSYPNRLIFSQTQDYTLKLFGKKTVQSIVVVYLDENEKIINLVDQWYGKDLPTKYGAFLLRRLNAKTVPWFIGVPPLEQP